ncbi:uncharacterized protein [Salminus brasiliensis]|uniref:uncharacterized protein isoform X2 n=1 Tax=Salminus brasiliensis TaxID=930266 RepID=UPI003B83A29D
MHSAVGLELCSGALLGLFLARSKYGFDNSIQIPSILPPIIMLIMMVLSLQTHGFQNKPFECRHIVLSSVIVIGFGLVEIGVFVLLGISMRNFDRTWILPLEALLHLILWVSVVCVLHRRGSRRLGCFSKHRETGSLCCAVVVAVLASVFGALCVHYVNEHMGNKKDGKGYMALTALLHVSAATSLFKHPDDLPNIPHCVIYIFGAVGLNTVNSIALVLELCLKAGSGARTVEDLRVIVLPSETLFIAGWLVLQIYGVCVAIRHRRKGGQGRTVCQVHQEMEGLSDTVL